MDLLLVIYVNVLDVPERKVKALLKRTTKDMRDIITDQRIGIISFPSDHSDVKTVPIAIHLSP